MDVNNVIKNATNKPVIPEFKKSIIPDILKTEAEINPVVKIPRDRYSGKEISIFACVSSIL
jgi:hypothetical protein